MKIVGATGLVISVTIFYLATLWALEWAWTEVLTRTIHFF